MLVEEVLVEEVLVEEVLVEDEGLLGGEKGLVEEEGEGLTVVEELMVEDLLEEEPNSSFLDFIDPGGLAAGAGAGGLDQSFSLLQEPEVSAEEPAGEVEAEHSLDELTEISDNMTAELLNLFGGEPSVTSPETEHKVDKDQPSEGKQNGGSNLNEPTITTKKRKRFLPDWMKTESSDAKHFKLAKEEDIEENRKKAEEFASAVQKEDDEFKSTCDRCGYKETNREELLKHRKLNHEGALFLCTFCHKEFSKREALQQHRKFGHLDLRKQPCGECGEKFAKKSALASHMKIHENINFISLSRK